MAGTSNLWSCVSTHTASSGPSSSPTFVRYRSGQSLTTSSAIGKRCTVANTARASYTVTLLPVQRLDEQVDRASTCQPDGEGLVVRITEGDDAAVPLACEYFQRGRDDCTFDAPARHGPRDFAVVTHRHRRARIARA